MIADGFKLLGAAHVFADSDEFHFRSDDALVGIPLLSNRMTRCFERLTFETWVNFEFVFLGFVFVKFLRMCFGDVAVVGSVGFAAFVFFNIASVEDPLTAECG